jgi:hypothetical protein
VIRARLLLVVVTAAACDDGVPPVIDPFPIRVSTAGGPLLAAGRTAEDTTPVVALVDTLTPLTVFDSFEPPADALPAPSRRPTTVTLHAACSDDDVACAQAVPRARFEGAAVIDLHPCLDPAAGCAVGLGDATAPFRAMIGADLLSQVAVRLDLTGDESILQFLPDIAGDAAQHCAAGVAVMGASPSGGGTLLIGGGEVNYAGDRLALDTCLGFDPDSVARPSGADAVLVLATGIGPTVLTEAAYRRYRLATDAPPLEELAPTTLRLPSGPIAARLGSLAHVAIVGSGAEARGPCEERRAAEIMRGQRECGDAIEVCPCPDDETSCATTAAVEFHFPDEAPIEVAIVSDEEPVLQALRDELRPAHAEVDGLLGMSALTRVRLDLDYPHSRLLAECGPPGPVDPKNPDRPPPACLHRTAVGDASAASAAEQCDGGL